MRDTLLGPSNVKRSASLYLPIPTAMFVEAERQPPTGVSIDGNDIENKFTDIVSNAPWRHQIPAYQAFLQRARFPDITALIHRGLAGIATKEEPEIELPSIIEYLEDNATRDGKSLVELFNFMISEVLAVGKVEVLVDVDQTSNQLVLVPYVAESFVNWKSAIIEDKKVITLSVLAEPIAKEDQDEFTHDTVISHNVGRMFVEVEGEVLQAYNTQKFIDDEAKGPPVIPTLRGNTFPEIPLVIASVAGTGVDVEWTCPLVGVSDLSVSIYQKDADMSNSEFLTCNPMLVFSGVDGDSDELPNIIGSSVTWALPDNLAKAYYVEPAGSCLSHMSTRIDNLFEEAVQYGVSVLGNNKSSGEAAETVKMRQAGNSSNLRTIIQSCAEALSDLLDICEMWEKNATVPSGEVEVKPNLELTEMTLTAQEQTALLQAWMNGAISHQSYLKNIKEAGIELDGDSVEEELDLIATSKPALDEPTAE